MIPEGSPERKELKVTLGFLVILYETYQLHSGLRPVS